VVALGICDVLPQAGIAWPHDVVDATSGELITHVLAHGGYDDEGMFVRVRLDVDGNVHDAIDARVDQWSGAGAGAPLAFLLGDYANKLVDLGKEVEVSYPNGRVYARGTFVGVDVWGRATVRLASGEDIEFAPEKYRIARLG
jgi:BirA family biotin operon repressor/biotin-[acetyl-CoA-carboxylase] ligase